MKKTNFSDLSQKTRDKIEEAKDSYQEMWQRIKPFVKKRKVKEYSTRGEWQVPSHEL